MAARLAALAAAAALLLAAPQAALGAPAAACAAGVLTCAAADYRCGRRSTHLGPRPTGPHAAIDGAQGAAGVQGRRSNARPLQPDVALVARGSLANIQGFVLRDDDVAVRLYYASIE